MKILLRRLQKEESRIKAPSITVKIVWGAKVVAMGRVTQGGLKRGMSMPNTEARM